MTGPRPEPATGGDHGVEVLLHGPEGGGPEVGHQPQHQRVGGSAGQGCQPGKEGQAGGAEGEEDGEEHQVGEGEGPEGVRRRESERAQPNQGEGSLPLR